MSATTISNTSVRKTAQAQRTSLTVWQTLVSALGVIVVIAFVLLLISAIQFSTRPFLGVMVTHTMVVNAGQPTSSTQWPGLEAGLQRGDQIRAINGVSLFDESNSYREAHAQYVELLRTLPRDASGFSTVEVAFTRPGSLSVDDLTYCNTDGLCSVTVTPTEFPAIDLLSYFVLPYSAGVIVLILTLLIARYKFNTSEGLMAIVIALLSALYAAGLFDVGTQGTVGALWLIGATWLGGSLITFGLVFPKHLKVVRVIPYLAYLPMVIATLIGLWLVYQYFNPVSPQSILTSTQLATTTSIIGLFALLLEIIVQRERANTPAGRDQSNTIFIGTSMMLVPAVIWFISNQLTINDATYTLFFNVEMLMLLFVFPNAAIAYAVLQYRLFDTDSIITQGVTYSIMVGALLVSMFLLSLGATLLSIDLLNAESNLVLIPIIIFVMVLAFTPIRNALQSRIDEIYFRKRRNLQARVEDFGRRLTTINEYERIAAVFKEIMDDTLAPSSLFIFLREQSGDYVAYEGGGDQTDVRFAANSPLISLLRERNETISLQPGEAWPHDLWVDRPRLNLLRAQLLTGMPGADLLNGFVIFGAPRQKDTFSHEEVKFVDNVVGQLAIATERSQVIGSLEQRVRELDVLSQVGQAVNFTIEFDDLLELIFNQTSRLLPVPNFYIVLYEEKINRLYFAFFLEGDDRFEEKEGVRWVLGNDLFSDVIKRNTAYRLANFTEEQQKRGGQMELLGAGLLAWMGVPLTAGRRTLGVMAAGKRNDTSEYTDEQFKIFSDIGALAATSLDKANLFNQTRIRERQLTALNDISQQLVAKETDVEGLLKIIMDSAVEILNAEAGSLLLRSEDDSGDLEFRVVVGGGGDELIGTRIPSGQGVVGSVVTNGEPMIVNDAETDPRHNEVSENFISRSLLAVPLIAKDQVIGVLEVINKRDGTPFIDDDSNLLTSFAGQAAIAIENARLFQQTDQQLSQRVKELETLERLDAQLNRTLDLNEVAKITVTQAMNILGADAGALGIVHQSPPYLEIAAISGYERDEYPQGAEGDDGLIWPLDEGIVRRVMRSRQPDIAMDVNIDPDYDSGLKGSLSQITLPMLSGSEINAILILEKRQTPRFSLPDWAFAQRLAEHASIAVANAQFAAELNSANKSKSEFMGFAAHELKNPLASVKGYAEVMLSGMTGELSEQQQNFVNIIRSNANRMQTIINDLRDAARIESNEFKVEPEPMSVRNAVVETLRPFVKLFEEKNQEMQNIVPEDLPLIWGDETRVIQVLTNLVSNAHKYSHSETEITVGGYLDENYVDRVGEKRGRMVVVYVKDQGIGMSEDDQAKLFKVSYFRSSNQEAQDMASGTGLGMMLTYNIMRQHAGDIWIESKLGEGSTFFISFPLAEDREKAIKERESEPAAD